MAKAIVEGFFREADVDGDGFLTMRDLDAILKKKGYMFTYRETRVHLNNTSLYKLSWIFFKMKK